MQVMNAKMQNLKPNLKDNKRTIWIFFFFLIFLLSWIYLIFRGWSWKRKQNTKTKRDHFPMVIKEWLQNCFIICILLKSRNFEGLKDPHLEIFPFGSLAWFWYSTHSPFILSGNRTPLSWFILFKQFNCNVPHSTFLH